MAEFWLCRDALTCVFSNNNGKSLCNIRWPASCDEAWNAQARGYTCPQQEDRRHICALPDIKSCYRGDRPANIMQNGFPRTLTTGITMDQRQRPKGVPARRNTWISENGESIQTSGQNQTAAQLCDEQDSAQNIIISLLNPYKPATKRFLEKYINFHLAMSKRNRTFTTWISPSLVLVITCWFTKHIT